MGFFDFLPELGHYEDDPRMVARMNARHRFLVEDFAADIEGARVLDLGAHDGRWAYAFAAAGAAHVVGIEARPELVARFGAWPDPGVRARVEMRTGDMFDGLEAARVAGEQYDVVGVLGVFYHIMDHYRLLRLVRAMRPRLVIIDGEFLIRPGAVIGLVREKTDNILNAAANFEGQGVTMIGIPSFPAMEAMADTLGYDIAWSDWDALPESGRDGLRGDYFREGAQKRRATCALRPRPGTR